MSSCRGLLLALVLCLRPVAAQPAFEVASVKPADAAHRGATALRGGPGTNLPGELSGEATLKLLIERAYGLKPFQISGPVWMETARYQVDARIPDGAREEEVALMLRRVLMERFHLVAHRETKDLPFYALVVSKDGLKMKPCPQEAAEPASSEIHPKLVKGADGMPDVPSGTLLPRSLEVVIAGSDGIRYKRWGRRETTETLAARLGSQLNRPVLDLTALSRPYDFVLTWTMESAGGGIPRTNPPPDEIDSYPYPVMTDSTLSIFEAVQRQLGLKLESRRGPIDMLVIDHADKLPTAN